MTWPPQESDRKESDLKEFLPVVVVPSHVIIQVAFRAEGTSTAKSAHEGAHALVNLLMNPQIVLLPEGLIATWVRAFERLFTSVKIHMGFQSIRA